MNTYFLMLQGGQEACLDIEAWDMSHAIRIANEKIDEGWQISKIRCDCGYEVHSRFF